MENRREMMDKYQDDFKSIFSNCENLEVAYFLLKAMQQQLIEEYKSSLIEKHLENQEPKSKSAQFAVHLPELFRKAINEKNFNSPLAQEFLSYIHSAIEQGKVSVLPRKYAQNAVDAGIKLKPEDFFVYVANGMENLYEVRQNLIEINLKHHRIARQATQNKKSAAKKKTKNVANPVTSKKSKKVFVILLPNKIKNAFKERDFESPEVQEYLSYILCAIDKGLLVTVERQNKAEVKKHNITLSDDSDLFFVAKDGAVYLQITHELHEIRKKYENQEKTANLSTKITIQTPLSKPHEEIKEKTSSKLSKKKSLKMKDKTVCMGGDGTIFYPFN